MPLFSMIFSWWNGATYGTLLTTWFSGQAVGTDKFGNRYYQTKDGKRRWVLYNGTVEASRVAGLAWLAAPHLHGSADRGALAEPRRWEPSTSPTSPGPSGAYRPDGSLARPACVRAGDRRLSGLETGIARAMQNNTVETLIGAIVVAVAVGFLYFAYASTNSASLIGLRARCQVPARRRPRCRAPTCGFRASRSAPSSALNAPIPRPIRRRCTSTSATTSSCPTIPRSWSTSTGLLGNSYLSDLAGRQRRMLPPGGAIK